MTKIVSTIFDKHQALYISKKKTTIIHSTKNEKIVYKMVDRQFAYTHFSTQMFRHYTTRISLCLFTFRNMWNEQFSHICMTTFMPHTQAKLKQHKDIKINSWTQRATISSSYIRNGVKATPHLGNGATPQKGTQPMDFLMLMRLTWHHPLELTAMVEHVKFGLFLCIICQQIVFHVKYTKTKQV